jgi:transcriptional regulator NrdR family protein
MNCPTCAHPDHRVLRTDAKDGRVRRARECLRCGHRWHTVEMPEADAKRADEVREVLRHAIRAVGEE